MKKTTSRILTTIIGATMLLSATPSVSAAENDTFSVNKGDTITYTVTMPEIEKDKINCFDMIHIYNNDKLKFEKYEWSDTIKQAPGNSCIFNPEYNEDAVRFNASTPDAYKISADDEIVTLTYTVLEDGVLDKNDFGTYSIGIHLYNDEIGNFDTFYKDSWLEGVIKVTPQNNFDVNFDGSVDIADATLIQKSCVGRAKLNTEQMERADVNKDGYINITDTTNLQKTLAQ